MFTDWIIVMTEADGLCLLDDNGQLDAFDYATGGEWRDWLEALEFEVGVYKISFKMWSECDYWGEWNSGLSVEKEEVLWQLKPTLNKFSVEGMSKDDPIDPTFNAP